MNKFSSKAGKSVKRVVVGLGLLSAAVATSVTANATTATNTFQVTATITSSCNVSGSTLNFGSAIDPLATGVPLDATSTLTVTCSNTTPDST